MALKTKSRLRWISLALPISTLAFAFHVLADDIPTTPTVEVVGHRVDGGALTCSFGGCFDSAQAEAARALAEWQRMHDTYPQDELPLDEEKFCEGLASSKPSGCNLASPPASPGITVPGQPAYAPNGCGTGGVGGWFQSFILSRISSSYSGDLDEPYSGVSFLSACNAHDACWAAGGPRAGCDAAFEDRMKTACAAVPDPEGTCSGFASLYRGAVSTTTGSDNAYATSTGNRQCALWARDMRENDCDD